MKDKYLKDKNRGGTYSAKILDFASSLLIIMLSFDTERPNMERFTTLIN